MTVASLREARERAAAEYKPDRVKLLLVGEAPPSAVDRYFYFPDVSSQDSLFRYAARGLLGIEPTRTNKPILLGKLRDAGVFLTDVCLDPILDKSELPACVPNLVPRAAAIAPDHIILIKATVFDAAFDILRTAALPVVDECIPFPGSGQQLRFEYHFGRALEAIGWVRPDDWA